MKARRIFLIVLGVLLVAILVFAGILTFNQNRFLRELPGEFESAIIFREQGTSALLTAPLNRVGGDERSRADFVDFETALQKSEFRLIVGLPQWKFDTSPKFLVDKDGDRIEVYQEDLNNLQANQSEYLVELFWGTGNIQNMKVQDTNIEFDTLRLILVNSNGRIAAIKAYAYIASDFVGGTLQHIEDTFINPFEFYANTTDLYKTVGDLTSRK
jgi:hypothetical protein